MYTDSIERGLLYLHVSSVRSVYILIPACTANRIVKEPVPPKSVARFDPIAPFIFMKVNPSELHFIISLANTLSGVADTRPQPERYQNTRMREHRSGLLPSPQPERDKGSPTQPPRSCVPTSVPASPPSVSYMALRATMGFPMSVRSVRTDLLGSPLGSSVGAEGLVRQGRMPLPIPSYL